MQVIEVSIKEIIVHLLRRWKTIVAIALILAIGFAALSYANHEVLDKMLVKSSNLDANNALQGESYEINIAIELTTFVGTSPDSYHITLATNDLLTKLVTRYTLLLDGAPLADVLSNSLSADFTNEELKEIVTIASPATGLLALSVKKNPMVNAQQAARDVFNYLMEQNELVTSSVTEHKLMILSETTVKNSDDVDDVPNYIKMAMLGFIIGLILGIALLTFLFLIKPTIQTPERINDTTGLFYLGGVLRKKHKTAADFVAGTMRMAYRENGIKLIAENMREMVQDGCTILFTGNIEPSTMEETAKKITKEIHREDMKVLIGSNINIDADTIRKLGESNAVVLMERLGVSRIKNIHFEKERIEMSKKPILGYVLI